MDANIRPGVVVMLFGFLGGILAFIEQYLNENNLVVNAYLGTDITLVALQTVTIIVALLFGCVVAAWTS